jgi:hypothetical protein
MTYDITYLFEHSSSSSRTEYVSFCQSDPGGNVPSFVVNSGMVKYNGKRILNLMQVFQRRGADEWEEDAEADKNSRELIKTERVYQDDGKHTDDESTLCGCIGDTVREGTTQCRRIADCATSVEHCDTGRNAQSARLRDSSLSRRQRNA